MFNDSWKVEARFGSQIVEDSGDRFPEGVTREESLLLESIEPLGRVRMSTPSSLVVAQYDWEPCEKRDGQLFGFSIVPSPISVC